MVSKKSSKGSNRRAVRKVSKAKGAKRSVKAKGPKMGRAKIVNRLKAKIVRKISKKNAKAGMKITATKAKIAKPLPKKEVKPPEPKIDRELEQALMKKVITILSDSRVRQNLIGIGGENALAIVRNFTGNQSDDDLAKKLKIKISDVRATLNKLHNEGLVNYIREKDSETGWYSYSWSLNHDRMERWASSHVGLKMDFGSESEYYFCPSCGTESITNFESASSCEFRCERCNKMMEFIDEKGIADLFEKKK